MLLARLTDAVAGAGAESILRNVFDSASDGDIQLLIDSSRMAAALGNRSSASSVESTWHSANGSVCGLINAGSAKIYMIHISLPNRRIGDVVNLLLRGMILGG